MLILIEHPKHGRMHVHSEYELYLHIEQGWHEVYATKSIEVGTNEKTKESPGENKTANEEALLTIGRKLRSDEEVIDGKVVRKRKVR